MKKFIMLFVILIFVVMCVVPVYAAADKTEKKIYGKIDLLIGQLDIKRKEGTREKAKINSLLYEGDSLKSYAQTRCVLELATKARIQIKGKSVLNIDRILVQDQGNESKLKMLYGNIKVKVDKLAKKNQFDIVTPTAVIGVRGTYFETESDEDTTLIKVYQGLVTVRNIDNKVGITRQVRSGFSCIIAKGSEASLPEPLKSYGSAGDDDTPPIITMIRPTVNYEVTAQETYNVMFIVIDDNLDMVYVNYEEVPNVKSNSLTRFPLTLYPGQNEIFVWAFDKNGNMAVSDVRVVEYRGLPPTPPER